MRLIDADALHKMLKKKQKWVVKNGDKHNEGYTYDQVHFAIDDAPTVDAEPVVRCKDCRHFELQDLSNPKHNTQWCIINGFNPQGMDYCSYGERMDGE